MGLIPGQKDLLEESMATHSRILPGESHGQSTLVGCRVTHSRTRLKRLSTYYITSYKCFKPR